MAKFTNELNNYQNIPRNLVFDINLSDRARFVYCFMACKPNDWDFYLEPMAKEIGYSVDTLRKYINELVESGWLEKGEQERDNGIFGAVSYTLKATKNTDTGKYRYGKIPTQHNIDNKQIIDSINKEKEDNKLSSQKKELTWRDDFQLFLAEVNKAKGILLVDATFRGKQERYYPNIDYVLSLEKMVDDYWGTEEAWNKRKKQKKNDEGIDMVATLKKAFNQSCNRVFKRRESTPRQADFFKGFTPQKISDRADDYLRTLKVDIKFEQDGVKYLKDDTFIQNGKRYYRNKFGTLVEVPIGLVARPNESWEYNKNNMAWVQDERTITTDDFML